jgi:coniferyl-aldehyde dehydrogenase
MSLVEADVAHVAHGLRRRLDTQREAFAREPFPTPAVRRERLDRILDVLRRHRDALAEAVSADFGHRSRHETLIADIAVTVNAVRHLRRNLARWMRPERRGTTLGLFPARAEVIVQPLGVVGIIGPWNYPILLPLLPLATALAAGNRAMVKLSEVTPRTAALLVDLLADRFADDLVTVVTGGPDVGEAFSRLPFDHLVFTGSTAVGRRVAEAAARNLVPVTLELGGKSPAIVHADYPLEQAAANIVANKLFNAGQTCISPDYALVPQDRVEAFVEACRIAAARLYPEAAGGPDYTSIVDARHQVRLEGLLADARKKGARIVPLLPPGASPQGDSRRMTPVAVCGATDDMAILNEEIFGPILPVVGVASHDEAIRYVNARPRPLSLYVFDHDRARADHTLRATHSGTAAINDCMVQFGEEHLPFGGIGPSGTGALHGREGFERLSHCKGVVRQARLHPGFLRLPPYGRLLERLLDWIIG